MIDICIVPIIVKTVSKWESKGRYKQQVKGNSFETDEECFITSIQ